ncbi:MAG: DNA-3-methyladenine glycosylase, partial [Actinobacteria bacterium]
EDGEAGAVLIRAVQPVQGIELMRKNRKSEVRNLTNGPAKLTSAMAVDRSHNGIDVTSKKSSIYVINYVKEDFIIGKEKRIGINKGKEKELRFYIKNNAFVSV